MSGFFEIQGRTFPISEIARIEPHDATEGALTIEWRDPNQCAPLIPQEQLHYLMRRPVQLIPAEAGTSVIRIASAQVWRNPVIAWALSLDGSVNPVCTDGVRASRTNAIYVEHPNKTIRATSEWVEPWAFDDAREMVRYFKELAEAGEGK